MKKIDEAAPKRKISYIILASIAIVFVAWTVVAICIILEGRRHIYTDLDKITTNSPGVVFGAGVTTDGRPTTALRDRLDTAIELYRSDKISSIYVSGDNSFDHRKETDVMENYLTENGIPEDMITQDPKGTRTYNTCYRMVHEYDLQEAILITQGYHLPRALFLCNHLGLRSSGFSSTKREYYYFLSFKIREIAAIYLSVLDAYIINPEPTN